MPSLNIFGRRWSISSDDFVVPEITEALIRFTWFIISFFLYVTRAKGDACFYLHLFMIGSLALNFLVLLFCLSIAYVSSLGTIFNNSPRRRLQCLLYLRCPLIVFEIVWNILGAIWLNGTTMTRCDTAFTVAVAATIFGGWLMLVILLVGIIMNFDPTGTIHHGDLNLADAAKKMYKTRIKMFCICASTSDKAKVAFEDVAELFVDLFADSDLVWTDVWAAMLLLAGKEMRVLNERSKRHAAGDAPNWMTIESASRIMEFSLGVYGWPYYLVGKGCSIATLCELARRGRCCAGGCGCDSAIIIKDNCCMCNTAALLLQTNLHETDLFYVNLHNEVWETPFVACFDHATKSIVIAVRGSLSLRDALTDLSAAEETLELNSCLPFVEQPVLMQHKSVAAADISFSNPNHPISEEQDNLTAADPALISSNEPKSPSMPPSCIKCRAHKGMLSSARYVASILDQHHILEDMLVLQPEYSLVITGHSLGAGVAALLGIMFKPRYPSLKCYSFSPPGCVLSREGVEFTKSFVYSLVFNDDVIPRLSIESMRALKQNVMDVLQNCDRPKYEIMMKGCYKLLCGAPLPRDASSTGPLSTSQTASPSSPTGVPDPRPGFESQPSTVSTAASTETKTLIQIDDDFSPLLSPQKRADRRTYTDEVSEGGASSSNGGRVQLFCPGRLMHLKSRPLPLTMAFPGGGASDSGNTEYVARWVDQSYFAHIRMSNSMIIDHMPWTLSNVLKAYLTQEERQHLTSQT